VLDPRRRGELKIADLGCLADHQFIYGDTSRTLCPTSQLTCGVSSRFLYSSILFQTPACPLRSGPSYYPELHTRPTQRPKSPNGKRMRDGSDYSSTNMRWIRSMNDAFGRV
jgi:hypothetical protein